MALSALAGLGLGLGAFCFTVHSIGRVRGGQGRHGGLEQEAVRPGLDLGT